MPMNAECMSLVCKTVKVFFTCLPTSARSDPVSMTAPAATAPVSTSRREILCDVSATGLVPDDRTLPTSVAGCICRKCPGAILAFRSPRRSMREPVAIFPADSLHTGRTGVGWLLAVLTGACGDLRRHCASSRERPESWRTAPSQCILRIGRTRSPSKRLGSEYMLAFVRMRLAIAAC